MEEMRVVHAACPGPRLVAGDFNLIYQAADKNNTNVDRAMMGRFGRMLNQLQLKKIELIGRQFTWSNERATPTLVRLDRVFCTSAWEYIYPNHALQSTTAGVSDHCPLVLCLRSRLRVKRRFHFESFWPQLDGFREAVQVAWTATGNPGCPMERLAAKLQTTSQALQAWSQRKVGNVA